MVSAKDLSPNLDPPKSSYGLHTRAIAIVIVTLVLYINYRTNYREMFGSIRRYGIGLFDIMNFRSAQLHNSQYGSNASL
jgi:hypothetical protein